MNHVFLTFDVEDFINNRSMDCLLHILKLLRRYNLKAIFFITGHMAEKIGRNKETISLLQNHNVGYHSSSHSVRPTIPEFTDTKDYVSALNVSFKREISHIDPLTGLIHGDGGIKILREIFPGQEVNAFRAPGCCWSPPHMEAIMKLGIKFDFSTRNLVHDRPSVFKGMTFYPTVDRSIFQIDLIELKDIPRLLLSILRRNITTLGAHPNEFVNSKSWDSIFFNGNPERITEVQPRPRAYILNSLCKLELILAYLSILKKRRMIAITPDLVTSKEELKLNELDIIDLYKSSTLWCTRLFKYEPIFLLSHFIKYFKQ